MRRSRNLAFLEEEPKSEEYFADPENFRKNVRKVLDAWEQWREALGEKRFEKIIIEEVMDGGTE